MKNYEGKFDAKNLKIGIVLSRFNETGYSGVGFLPDPER